MHGHAVNLMKIKVIFMKYDLTFQKLHRAMTSLLNAADMLVHIIDMQKTSISVFLRLKKGFCKIDNEIIL